LELVVERKGMGEETEEKEEGIRSGLEKINPNAQEKNTVQ
jgi:hypothetical protein